MTYTRFSGFGYRRALAGWWRVACLLVTLCLLQGAFPTSARATSLERRDDLLSSEAWPAVTVLADLSGTLLVNDVIAEGARSPTPPAHSSPLGVRVTAQSTLRGGMQTAQRGLLADVAVCDPVRLEPPQHWVVDLLIPHAA